MLYPAEKKFGNTCAFICYFLCLIFPVVTLILLRTNPWLPDQSLCDPNMKMTPCTCNPEFPATASVLAGIEIFIFFLFMWFNPLVNARGRDSSENCSPVSCARLARISGAITYVTFLIVVFLIMTQSNQYCGIAIFFWTMCSSLVRVFITCLYVALYEHQIDDQKSNEGPIAL